MAIAVVTEIVSVMLIFLAIRKAFRLYGLLDAEIKRISNKVTTDIFRVSFSCIAFIALSGCGGGSAATPTTPPAETTAREASPTIPAAIPTPTSTLTIIELAGEEYKKLGTGVSVFNPPVAMTVNESQIITYRIQASNNITSSIVITEGLPVENRQVIKGDVKISSFMKVTLDGDTFSIVPLQSDENKPIISGVPNDWSWRVTPKSSGTHSLTLRVTASIEVGNRQIPYDFPVQEKTVMVQVNLGVLMSTTMKEYWPQLTALFAALSALAGFIYRHRSNEQKPKPVQPKTTPTKRKKAP